MCDLHAPGLNRLQELSDCSPSSWLKTWSLSWDEKLLILTQALFPLTFSQRLNAFVSAVKLCRTEWCSHTRPAFKPILFLFFHGAGCRRACGTSDQCSQAADVRRRKFSHVWTQQTDGARCWGGVSSHLLSSELSVPSWRNLFVRSLEDGRSWCSNWNKELFPLDSDGRSFTKSFISNCSVMFPPKNSRLCWWTVAVIQNLKTLDGKLMDRKKKNTYYCILSWKMRPGSALFDVWLWAEREAEESSTSSRRKLIC